MALGLAVIAALAAGGLWLADRDGRDTVESAAGAAPVVAAPWAPGLPRNQPFPGPDTGLPADAQHAVTVAAELARAGAETKVTEVKLTTYEAVMCGRMASYDHTPRMVWIVGLEGPFRFLAASLPSGAEPPAEQASVLYVLDAASFASQQSFSPWPLPRTIANAKCPPE